MKSQRISEIEAEVVLAVLGGAPVKRAWTGVITRVVVLNYRAMVQSAPFLPPSDVQLIKINLDRGCSIEWPLTVHRESPWWRFGRLRGCKGQDIEIALFGGSLHAKSIATSLFEKCSSRPDLAIGLMSGLCAISDSACRT